MALFDFEEEVHIAKRKLFAVICIDQSPEHGFESPINEMIEIINKDLKKSLDDYESVSLAYVYESAGMTEAVPFFSFTENSGCLYANLPIEKSSHNLSHLFFLSMGMLEQVQKQNQAIDCRMYLLTNERFPRLNQIVWQSDGKIEINKRFRNVPVQIILYKPARTGGDLLERYIRSQPGNQVIEI